MECNDIGPLKHFDPDFVVVNNKLLPDQMTGSTFTVSNMGMLDVENFAAIINPGESAILAVSSTRDCAVVVEIAHDVWS